MRYQSQKRQKKIYLKCQESYTALSNMDELENEIDIIDENDMEESEVGRHTAEWPKILILHPQPLLQVIIHKSHSNLTY